MVWKGNIPFFYIFKYVTNFKDNKSNAALFQLSKTLLLHYCILIFY